MPGLALRHWNSPRLTALLDVLRSRQFVVAIILPVLVLVAGTLLFRATSLDLAICRLFFDPVRNRFPLLHAQPWALLYEYGPIPGMVLGIAGWVVGVAGLALKRWQTWGKAGVFVGLALALGPGIAVNGIFKPNWGRPRPNQVEEFGGAHNFLQVGEPGWSSDHRSFPCGHASMGFFLLVPAFLLFRRYPRLAWTFLAIGISAGACLGLARVVQGRHFPSDVLWSAGMVYFAALAAWFILGFWRSGEFWGTAPSPDPQVAADGPAIFHIEDARREREKAAAAQEVEPPRRKSA